MRTAAQTTGGAGGLGDGYRAQKREFLGIGLSCLPDEASVDAVRQAVEARSRLTISFINHTLNPGGSLMVRSLFTRHRYLRRVIGTASTIGK